MLSSRNANLYFPLLLDLVRALRYFTTFNSIVQRTVESAPTLVGPLSLVFSWMHLSVFLGMALWRGEIQVGSYEGKITPLYGKLKSVFLN